MVGLAPGAFTLRELLWMAEARADENWKHTAAVLAMLLNVNRGRKSDKVWTPRDFPRVAPKSPRTGPPKADITILKAVFIDAAGGSR